MNPRLPVTVAILILTALRLAHGRPAKHKCAEVKGIVTDTNSAKVPGASLVFTSQGKEYTVLTSEDGTYTIRLNPDIYTVRASKFGFCDGHRSAFTLKENTKAQIDFQ